MMPIAPILTLPLEFAAGLQDQIALHGLDGADNPLTHGFAFGGLLRVADKIERDAQRYSHAACQHWPNHANITDYRDAALQAREARHFHAEGDTGEFGLG